MRLFVASKSSARFIFIIGILLMFLGIAVLIGSLAAISQTSILFSFLFIILGAVCAVPAIKMNKRSLYLFFAALFLQVGLFLFLFALQIIPITFSRAWPLLSIFSGLALFPTGWHRYGVFKAKYVAPSAAFIVLGSALMIFSLDLVSFSLAQFVRNWWPLLVVLAGLTLLLISLSTKNTGESKR